MNMTQNPMGGTSPFMPNRFSGTMPLGLGSRFPMKPNPVASTNVAPATPATAAGINGMKTAETYHYGRTGKKPSDDVIDNPIKGALGTTAGEKQARNMGLGQVPMGIGPQNMYNALSMFNQARTLVDPSETLRKHNLSQEEFENMADELANTEGDSYDFDAMRQDPRSSAITKGLLGAGVGAVIGRLGGKGLGGTVGLAALGGLGGAGHGYGSASGHNKRLLGTSKVLRDYGLLQPDYLRAALPLLKAGASAPIIRASATGEGKTKYKVDPNADAKGHEAFKSLDQYMKKAGLNSFQANFFGRLVQSGMNEGQIRYAVKQANAQFGAKVGNELNDGLEKLAGIGSFLQDNKLTRGVGQARDAFNGLAAAGRSDPQAMVDKAFKEQVTSRYGNLFSLGDKLNQGVGYLQQNPMMLMAALGGLGGGYALGGRGGAALGGIGLPMLLALAQNPEMFNNMLSKFNLGGQQASPNAGPAGGAGAAAPPPASPSGAAGAAAAGMRPAAAAPAPSAGAPQVPNMPKPPQVNTPPQVQGAVGGGAPPAPTPLGAAGAAVAPPAAPQVPGMANLRPPMPGMHIG